MGSKKDRLRAAADDQLRKATKDSAGMRRLVHDIEEDRHADSEPEGTRAAPEPPPAQDRKVIPEVYGEQNDGTVPSRSVRDEGFRAAPYRESIRMARTRDSVYNVSSDIRLEDYTDSQGGGGGGRVARIVAMVVLALLVGWGVVKVWGWIFSPGYQLAIAGQEITEENMSSFLKNETVSSTAGRPMVHIRFQWREGDLKTDLVRIRADHEQGGNFSEIASLSRRVPVTVTYVYFASVLEPGKYRIQVMDKEGKVLRERTVRVQ